MFGGQAAPVRVAIRLILGRGWGQGPTHSQSLQSWFAHVPGLKVVMPAFPADAKGLLLSGLFADSPVVKDAGSASQVFAVAGLSYSF